MARNTLVAVTINTVLVPVTDAIDPYRGALTKVVSPEHFLRKVMKQ